MSAWAAEITSVWNCTWLKMSFVTGPFTSNPRGPSTTIRRKRITESLMRLTRVDLAKERRRSSVVTCATNSATATARWLCDAPSHIEAMLAPGSVSGVRRILANTLWNPANTLAASRFNNLPSAPRSSNSIINDDSDKIESLTARPHLVSGNPTSKN